MASLLLTNALKGISSAETILGEDTWNLIQKITLENVIRTPHESNTRHPERKHRRTGTSTWKKPVVKPKPTSFDSAMKQKIVSDLNKVSPTNYDSILKSLRSICSRLSDEEHPWALRLILENATRQHTFAVTYIRLYKDIASDRKEDVETATKIILEFMTSHKDKILTSIDNGTNYDEFCKANKMKTQLIGHSIVLAEAANHNMLPLKYLGPHATELVEVLKKVIQSADNVELSIPRETTENSVKCIIDFFSTLSKTKSERTGFKQCIKMVTQLLDQEKTEKHLSPKARFALMDFIDEMSKL